MEVTREEALSAIEYQGTIGPEQARRLAVQVVALYDLIDQLDHTFHVKCDENDVQRECIDRQRDGWVQIILLDPEQWVWVRGKIVEPMTPEQQAAMAR